MTAKCCSIFNKDLYKDANGASSFTVDIAWLRSLIPPFNAANSGVWLPIIVNANQSKLTFVDILSRASNTDFFNPCQCVGLDNITAAPDNENTNLDCSYCGGNDYQITWNLVDNNPKKSPSIIGRQKGLPSITTTCCDGACDVRMYKDDYLTKLPVLNNAYLTNFYDWKYSQQFPACSNLGLGCENFANTISLSSFVNNENLKLRIDWKLKERISEIPPNGIDTHHKTLDDHEQAYNRSLGNSKTCGNFVLTSLHSSHTNNPSYPIFSGLISNSDNTVDYRQLLPNVDQFESPFGFNNEDHYNIFVKKEKLGSYWKWNYTSGILCWYRYYDINRPTDNRLIPGVELYISDGDVFYATNDGPEPLPVPRDQQPPNIKACPSGLKLIKNGSVTGIIPSGSNFVYISTNLYNKAYSILDKLYNLEESLRIPADQRMSPIQKLELSSLLATGPDYHEVTVDLLKPLTGINVVDYPRDTNKQIILFNQAMLRKEQYKANQLNIIKTKEDLINTLVNKYGCYIWCPPKTTTNITLKQNMDPHCYVDLDFEPVVKLSDTRLSRGCSKASDCGEPTTFRHFSYDQKIDVGNLSFSTSVDKRYKNQSCDSGVFTINSSADVVNAYFNGAIIKQEVYGSGCTSFYHKYLRPPSYDLALKKYDEILCSEYAFCNKTLAFKYNNDNDWWDTPEELQRGEFQDASVIMNRGYPINYININANRIGFHKDGGLYHSSNTFGTDNVVFINNAVGSSGQCNIAFTTKDVGIKLYSIAISKLRSASDSQCKTFPLNQACKCFPLVSVNGYKHSCDNTLRYSNRASLLYTPNLSTQSSPILKSYGGYTSNELVGLIGSQTIPNHPAAGTSLATVDKKIDPLNPYECTKDITIGLPNYIYNKWKLSLSRYNTNHSDVWIHLSDGSNLFQPIVTLIDPDDEIDVIDNPSSRRFTTKGIINDTTVYHNQEKVLFSKDSSVGSIDIQLINPYLYALLQVGAGYDFSKSPYSNLPCSQPQSLNPNTDVISVGLTFKQVPRKQLLNFSLRPITPFGSLIRTFFDPQSGLMTSTGKTSLSYRPSDCTFDFNYEVRAFQNNNVSAYNSGIMLRGNINEAVKYALRSTDSLSSHKKLRLYVQHNGAWYEYLNPHMFGYYSKDQSDVYPGYPMYFEYTSYNNSRFVESPLIPASPKYNTPLFYIQNIAPTGFISGLAPQMYPMFYNKFSPHIEDGRDTKHEISIPGSRIYFALEEQDSAIRTASIPGLSNEQQDQIVAGSTVLETTTNKRFAYRNGPKTDVTSYVILTDRNVLDNNYSDLLIDLANTDEVGYISNTNRLVAPNTFITLVGEQNPRVPRRYQVVNKSLYNRTVSRFGNEIQPFDVRSEEHVDIFTVLKLKLCDECQVEPREGLVQLENKSLVLLQDFGNSVMMENSQLLSNNLYKTKWGDLINFDKRIVNDLNNSPFMYQKLGQSYPQSSPYDNLLYKISLNNFDISALRYHVATATNTNAVTVSGNHSYSGIPNFHIHQKYNIGSSKEYSTTNIDNYRNFIPIIDISLPREKYSQQFLRNNTLQTGLMYISGIRSFTETKDLRINPETNSIFFVSLQQDGLLRPVLFDRSFYNDTLRVDHTYFRLSKLSKENKLDSQGCTSIIQPDIRFNNTAFNSYFNVSRFGGSSVESTFAAIPIYCDSDIPGRPCGNQNCSMKTIGYTFLDAEYYHHTYKYLQTKDLTADSIPYALSVDEGLYNNALGLTVPYITRFEVPPNSTLFNDNTSVCFPGKDYRPPLNPTYIDTEYQTKLQSYILSEDNKGTVVRNTDILANEMLFRLLYGSKQKISYDTIKKKTVNEFIKDNNQKSLSYLVQYTDNKTTADKIYDLIPYDYSLYADTSRRKISGTISIDGVLTVGSTATVDIDGNTISISVRNIRNKITAIASCNGKTYESVIKDTSPTSSYTMAIQAGIRPSPAAPNERYKKIGGCKNAGIQSRSWLLSHWTSNMRFTQLAGRGGEKKEISIEGDYRACVKFVAEGTEFDPPGRDPRFGAGDLYDWDAVPPRKLRGPLFSGHVISFTSCGQAYGACSALCGVCDPRSVPYVPCTQVASNQGSVTFGGFARGLLSNGSCFSRRGGCFTLSPALRVGDFDALIGGTTITNYGFGFNCRAKSNKCSSCMKLDDTDKWGKVFDVLKGSDYGTPCECQQYTHGYCTISERTCSCEKYASGFPKIFNYNFEYCGMSNYKFNNIKGHLYKYADGEPIVSDGVAIQATCDNNGVLKPACTSGMDLCMSPLPGTETPECPCSCSTSCSCDTGTADESCVWSECRGDVPPDWDIYEVTTTNSDPYNPLCPEQLCYINYDNNRINISLAGGKTGCFDIRLRYSCPTIEITLPNNTFTFNDSITSECSTCDVEPNKIIMNPIEQNPNWDIIEETRTAVLGYLPIEGNKNVDVIGAGAVWAPIIAVENSCGIKNPELCCHDGCYGAESASIQCGKGGDASRPWGYALTCRLNGSAGPSFVSCLGDGNGAGTVWNIGGGPNFATGSDNATVKSLHINYWKSIMKTIYADTSACHNNIGAFVVSDLVEGVVPGSCSQLNFSVLNYPMIAVRQTLGGGEMTGGSYGVHVAYYTYRYRRPKTIQDILLGNNASKCSTINSQLAPSYYNITEKYTVKDCESIPSCFDKTINACDETNYCCNIHQYSPSVSSRTHQ